jgi:hypothetical protein
MYDMLRIIKSGIKQDALSPLFFNFALESAIRRVQVDDPWFRGNMGMLTLIHGNV